MNGRFCRTLLDTLPLHVAKKHIRAIGPSGEYPEDSPRNSPNGVKLELFIFDTFAHARNLVGLQARYPPR